MSEDWASIDEIIADAEIPRKLVIEYEGANGTRKSVSIYYCELTGEETNTAELASLIDEDGKPTDQVAAVNYIEQLVLKRLMKANGKVPGWEIDSAKWKKLPESTRAEIMAKMGRLDKERTETFLDSEKTAA